MEQMLNGFQTMTMSITLTMTMTCQCVSVLREWSVENGADAEWFSNDDDVDDIDNDDDVSVCVCA